MRRSWMALGALVAVLGASCGTTDTADGGLSVVATTTIIGDLVANVVGDAGTVEVLMPVGADPHAFQPSARQAARLAEADLVVANGLGLEEGLEDLLATVVEEGGQMMELAPALDPLPVGGDGSAEHDADPHVWMDPVRMADGVTIVGDRLADLAQAGGGELRARAAAYREEVLAAHERNVDVLSVVPDQRRTLVTNHDALRYFADRYGFEIIGVVIPGGSTLAEPSAAELTALAETIRTADVPAIFSEDTASTRLAEAVAAEVGREVEVVELATGSLGPDGSDTATYLGLIETDAARVAEALRPR